MAHVVDKRTNTVHGGDGFCVIICRGMALVCTAVVPLEESIITPGGNGNDVKFLEDIRASVARSSRRKEPTLYVSLPSIGG